MEQKIYCFTFQKTLFQILMNAVSKTKQIRNFKTVLKMKPYLFQFQIHSNSKLKQCLCYPKLSAAPSENTAAYFLQNVFLTR